MEKAKPNDASRSRTARRGSRCAATMRRAVGPPAPLTAGAGAGASSMEGLAAADEEEELELPGMKAGRGVARWDLPSILLVVGLECQ